MSPPPPRAAPPYRPSFGERPISLSGASIERSAAEGTPILAAVSISKTYGKTAALQDVSVHVYPGEVHALLGENGAGKSTLLKVLSGIEAPSAGEIEIDDATLSSLTPALALHHGIQIVPQHLELAEDLSIADNLFLNRWPRKRFLIDRAAIRRDARRVLKLVGLQIDPDTIVRDLTYVEKQMVEIARVSEFFNPRVIILDEPTSALSIREVEILFAMVGRLKASGVAVLYVSHFLGEISRIADRVTILRDGRVVASGLSGSMSTEKIIFHMVGDIADLYPRPSSTPGDTLLEVRGMRTDRFGDVSFTVHRGEILGIAAPKGEGVSEFFRALCGISSGVKAGEMIYRGVPFRAKTSQQALELGIGYLSEERSRWGLIRGKRVLDNLTISGLRKYVRWLGLIDEEREREDAESLSQRFLVRGPGIDAPIEALSGGNQQKVLLARLFNADLSLFVLDDPTFGVDVGSKAEINGLLSRAVEAGASVLLSTSDLPELIQMSHRVVLIKNGSVERTFARDEVAVDELAALLEGLEEVEA